jgi:hypothetical protein
LFTDSHCVLKPTKSSANEKAMIFFIIIIN